MNFKCNNLDRSNSPYLIQHKDNPVWWQEWSSEIIKYAAENKIPIFVSVGYSTCHWCHVMAGEAFSDAETADFLNSRYICIKIDREQRPDIDQFMMDFINRQNGSGGWPLNVFLTADLRPVFALTYAPAKQGSSNLSFLSIAQKVYNFILENSNEIPVFNPEPYLPSVSYTLSLKDEIVKYFDPQNGGFGSGHKFPSHSVLLFLMYLFSAEVDKTIRDVCIKTLDAMRLRGLNDHLQGGIFRYCVDPQWTIPHFEKMLYDQAMSLWVYSLAYRLFGDVSYKSMAENILICLEESFEENGFYISALDADTGHVEGDTYLWKYDDLKNNLTDKEFIQLSEVYFIEKSGNFDGRIHLTRRNDIPLKDIENKLLSIRKGKKQPSRDSKILCGTNALIAIAFIQAGRHLDKSELERKASVLIRSLINRFWDGHTLGHSLFIGVLQKQSFMSDASAMLLAVTLLFESDESWREVMFSLMNYVSSFRESDFWIESRPNDFPPVRAALFDHPVPSGISLAQMGLTRAGILTGKESAPVEFRQALQADFYNISAMMTNGFFHVYTSKDFIPWSMLPVNSLQKRGEPETDCFMGSCKPL